MKVEISIHATQLKNVAGTFKGTSDPFAVVTQMTTQPGEKPKVLGKTEVVKNNLSPQWTTVFTTDFELGVPVKVAINVFDEVKKGSNKGMGSAVFDLGECLGARGNVKAKKLRKGGTLFCAVRKSQGSGMLRLKLKGSKLKNVEGGLFGKSDPFFEASRKVNSAGSLTWDNVYRSKHLKNNLNPAWETAIIPLSTLCNGDLDNPVQIAVYDHEGSGKHVSMGMMETSVNGLVRAAKSGDEMKLTRKGKEMGIIQVVSAEVAGVESVTQQMAATRIAAAPAPAAAPFNPATAAAPAPFNPSAGVAPASNPNFLDYISGGCELNVAVAIDFTGSNGDPRKPGTLHHIGSTGRTDYEKAISAIVSILAKYDSDQQFPVYGFGAKYGGVVRHCFQCGPTAEVHGVQGVLNAYRQVFSSGLIMSGPTVFTEVLQTAAAKAASANDEARRKGSQAYTILLILTDGAVTDPQGTAQVLKQISNTPLSVVIVGIGNADFSSMQFLDDSAGPGQRDIAQFVEFNKHCSNSVALTSETLHEIPDQLTGFFQSHGVAPLPALTRGDSVGLLATEAEEEIDLTLDIGEDEIVVTGGGVGFVDGFNAMK